MFSGGEATRQPALIPAAQRIRDLGLRVGLHTGGAYSARLRELFDRGLLDWVGFDVKAPPSECNDTVQTPAAWSAVETSLRLLLAEWRRGGVDVELRMTVTPAIADRVVEVVDVVADLARDAAVEAPASAGGLAQMRAAPGVAVPSADAFPLAPPLVLQQVRAEGTPDAFVAVMPPQQRWNEQFGEIAEAAQEYARRCGIEVMVRQ